MGAAAILYGDQGSTLLAITWTWASLAIILYGLRAASAARLQSTDRFLGLRLDFICVSLAFVATLTAQITTTISLERARSTDQGLDTISDVIYTGLVANCAAIFGMIFGRLAVVALLLQLHGPTYPNGKIALWVIAISQSVFSIVQVRRACELAVTPKEDFCLPYISLRSLSQSISAVQLAGSGMSLRLGRAT